METNEQEEQQQHKKEEDVQGGAQQDKEEDASTAQFAQEASQPWFTMTWRQQEKDEQHKGPAWVPDAAVTSCTDCGEQFGWLNRRHHCRFCGRIFCGRCAALFRMLPVEFGVREPQRVCTGCAAELEPLQESLVKAISNQSRTLSFDPNDMAKFVSSPVSFNMTAEILKAAHSVENFFGFVPNSLLKDHAIPISLLRGAKGLAFLSVFKAGFLVSGRVGTGLVISRLSNGDFSAPSAIGTVGMGWGAQIGAEFTDFVIILNTQGAVDAFSGAGQVSLGGELGVALGPLGRSSEADVNIGDGGIAPVFTYSQSKGFFAGISLEGAVISARPEVNRRFYGRDCPRQSLLNGDIPPPVAAAPLYRALQRAISRTE